MTSSQTGCRLNAFLMDTKVLLLTPQTFFISLKQVGFSFSQSFFYLIDPVVAASFLFITSYSTAWWWMLEQNWAFTFSAGTGIKAHNRLNCFWLKRFRMSSYWLPAWLNASVGNPVTHHGLLEHADADVWLSLVCFVLINKFETKAQFVCRYCEQSSERQRQIHLEEPLPGNTAW